MAGRGIIWSAEIFVRYDENVAWLLIYKGGYVLSYLGAGRRILHGMGAIGGWSQNGKREFGSKVDGSARFQLT